MPEEPGKAKKHTSSRGIFTSHVCHDLFWSAGGGNAASIVFFERHAAQLCQNVLTCSRTRSREVSKQ